MDSDEENGSKKRKSQRTLKKREFFHTQSFKSNKKRKVSKKNEETDEEGPAMSSEEIRERHVEKLTNIFREYVSDKLENIDLSPEREKTRVTGLIKNLKNSIDIKNKVYANNNGYLVTSSSGNETYTVKQKAIADKVKFVCNCGDKYQDNDRTSCKHCGAMLFYNFDHFMTEYLTKKPTTSSMNLHMYNMQTKFNKFEVKDNVKSESELTEKVSQSEKDDFFRLVLKC